MKTEAILQSIHEGAIRLVASDMGVQRAVELSTQAMDLILDKEEQEAPTRARRRSLTRREQLEIGLMGVHAPKPKASILTVLMRHAGLLRASALCLLAALALWVGVTLGK